MNELSIIEYKNIRVLTTQQIADSYETEERRIVDNFNRNKDRYKEGKHYICLTGEELRDFRAKTQNEVLPNANKFYLWTEKGAFLHAKSLNTDKAWEVYDVLVDTYFYAKRQLSQLQILQESVEILNRHETEIKQIDSLEQDMPLYGCEIDEVKFHVNRRGVNILGGKQSEAYRNASIRSTLYSDMYRQLKREFGAVTTYKSIKRKYVSDIHEFIDCYTTPLVLQEQINGANAQMRMAG